MRLLGDSEPVYWGQCGGRYVRVKLDSTATVNIYRVK
jgi:hypothetical protein